MPTEHVRQRERHKNDEPEHFHAEMHLCAQKKQPLDADRSRIQPEAATYQCCCSFFFKVVAPLTDEAFRVFAALTGNAEPQAGDNRLGLIGRACVCANDMWRDNQERKTSKKKKKNRGWQTYNIRVTLQQTIQSVCVCVFLYRLHTRHQNLHSSSNVRAFLVCPHNIKGGWRGGGVGGGVHDVYRSSHKDRRNALCVNVCACVCVCLCTDDSTSRSVRLF